MKATEQYFPLLLFDMLYKVLLISVSVTIQMKATEQYFLLLLFDMLYKVRLISVRVTIQNIAIVALFIMLYKVVLSFSFWIESESLGSDQS